MKFWRVVGVLLIALAGGCAVSPYRQAESYFTRKEYKKALRAYLTSLRPHVRRGKRYIYYDPAALTGLAVVYWHMKQYDRAFRILGAVTRRDSTYGKALLYQGACYEVLGQIDRAVDVYKRYAIVPEEDRYREIMQARLDWLVRQKIAQEVRQAIADEQKLSVSSIPKNTVAVLYFYNLTDDPRWNPLQKGLAEMMITDFAQVEQLRVVERLRLQKLIEEMNLSMTGLMDADRSHQLAKFLGARILVKGSYMVLSGMKIELSAGAVDILETDLPELSRYDGRLTHLFALEKKIVLESIAKLGVTLTPEQRERIMKVPTKNFKAFLNFCYGLDATDLGNFEIAQQYFQESLRLDPGFTMAEEVIVRPEIFKATHIQDVTQMNTRVAEVMEPSRTIAEEMGARRSNLFTISTTSRLQEMGTHMDAGFIPSNDSREAYEEASEGGVIRVLLPDPPAPPFIPDRWFLPGPPDPPSRR